MRQAGSHTATLVALYRAIESSRPAPARLFEDRFAPAFLGPRARWALRLSRLPVVGAALPWALVDGHWSGPRGTVAVRTRYIDDALGDALRAGVDQVVILGAGFDCRAYRIPGIDRARVFEVDHPATQARKREIITRRLGTLPPHVTLVPVDLATQALDAIMPGAGYRGDARTFFICEGLTHYLPPAVVDAVFRFVARPAGGSQMVFTYIHRAMLDGSVRFEGAANTLATVQRAGEPYTFGWDPAELPEYLAKRNLRLIEDVGAEAYRARYLLPRGRQQEPLADYQRAARVEVVGD
ncbi:MAG TPA: SAM-dependent methyltransferase [Verrucomicrobiae bacterium]|jgi:methyltransferase (TIGR00027 family)|nr:SAM-dependent methyltransferase [Verrucomicrobiae bacterium]